MVAIHYYGTEELTRWGEHVRHVAGDGVRNPMAESLAQVAPRVEQDIRRGADRLPHRGGLSRGVADCHIRVEIRAGEQTVMNLIARRGKWNLRGIDAGVVRHYVWQSKRRVAQQVPSGWFSDSIDEGMIEDAVARGVERTAEMLGE